MSDDTVGRQDMLDAVTGIINKFDGEYTAEQLVMLGNLIQAFKKLPSYGPKKKTGKWIVTGSDSLGKCSVCGMYCGGYDLEDSDRYCRCCGAKMEGIEKIL